MEAIRLGRDVTYLFPNIRSISLGSMYVSTHHSSEFEELCNYLLSPTIEQFCLHIINYDTLQHLCRLATTRFSALRSFEVQHTNGAAASAFPPIVKELLTCFAHTLTSVCIPLSLNIPLIAECLSRVPNLRNLAVGHNQLTGLKRIQNEIVNGDRKGLTSLLSFSFDDSPQSLYDLFLNPYDLISLQMFTWNVRLAPADVGVFISTIVVTCPCLRSLTLGTKGWRDRLADPWPKVPWSSIQPISRCKELTSLSLNRMHISLSLEQLTEFLKSRTTWTHLDMLTSDPLRLHDMLLYAECCPLLQYLGIFVDDRLESFVQDLLPHDIPVFHFLTSINFAYSHITEGNTNGVAEFIYHICKDPPRLIHTRNSSGQIWIQNVSKCLASLYIDREYRSGNPMTSKVKTFVEKHMADSTREVEFMYEDGSVYEDEDEDEDEDWAV